MSSGLRRPYSSNIRCCSFTRLRTHPHHALLVRHKDLQASNHTLKIQIRYLTARQQGKFTKSHVSNDDHNGSASPSIPHPDAQDWNSRLDPYLPLQLRSKTWLENLAAFEGVRSAESLPPILEEARLVYPQTILAHLGLVQGKWDAALWLTKALVSCKPEGIIDVTQVLQLESNRTWAEIRGFAPTWVDPLEILKEPSKRIQSHNTLDALTGNALVSSRQHRALWQSAIGQVWQCLGHVVIEASNLDVQDRSRMMSFVYQVIAHIHTEGAASPRIYQFDKMEVPSPICKPPYLHLMSSRIMAALSDAMWKITEPKLMGDAAMVAANYAYKGLEMPGSELNPRVQPLGPEVWLEFILWSCIHGSHFIEAGNLIQHANSQQGTQKWKTKGWRGLQAALNKRWEFEKNKSRLRQWFDRIAGTREGYSQKPPAVTLGEKTLSREVVAATAHGLVSADASGTDRHQRVAAVWSSVLSCRSMTCDHKSSIEALFWESILFKLFEDSNGAGTPSGDGASRKLMLAEAAEQNLMLFEMRESTSLAQQLAENRTSSLHPILLRALDQCVKREDVLGVAKTFEMLKGGVDRNMDDLIDEEHSMMEGPAVPTILLTAYVPCHIVADLFNQVTKAKAHSLGRTLLPMLDPSLGSSIIYGPTVSKSNIVQNSLLRFANAFSDKDLETSVVSRVTGNSNELPDGLILELLHSQLTTSNWDNAETLLLHVQFERRLALSAVDIANIAALQIRRPRAPNIRHILESVLNREYLPPPDYSKPPNYLNFRILNQMSRLLASIPGGQTLYAERYIVSTGQASNPIAIPSEAFNILLRQVVTVSGVPSGISFFEHWCNQNPRPLPVGGAIETASPSSRTLNDDNGPIVQPNMQTLRVLTAPSLRVLQDRLEKEQKPKLRFLTASEPLHDQTEDQSVQEENTSPPSTQWSAPASVTWERCYEAWMQLSDSPKLEEEIGWAIGMSEQLGLEKPGVHEQLLRPVEKWEIEDRADLEGGEESTRADEAGPVDKRDKTEDGTGV